MTARGWCVAALLIVVGALSPVRLAGQQAPPASPPAPDPNYAEGRRLFETLEYEQALKALNQAIAGLEVTTASARDVLMSAYELRARSKFGLGDTEGAKADFAALLKLNPDYSLTGSVSPRVVSLFDETIQSIVTTLTLSVTPATARLQLDGAPASPGPIRVAVGDHVVVAERPGYRRLEQTVKAEAKAPNEVALVLDRVSAVLNVLTAPPGVDVQLDKVSVGKTSNGPAAPDFAEAITRSGVAGSDVSSVLTVLDVAPGSHTLVFSRDCFVSATYPLPVDTPDDYTIGPVKLQPATATLSVTANAPGAQVFVDGEARGPAPFAMANLCEGQHTVELRSSIGRFVSRVEARTGAELTVSGAMTPAFALVPPTGQPGGPGADRRLSVERALEGVRTLTFFVPPANQAETALAAVRLPADWLGLDANGRPANAPTRNAQTVRGDASQKLAAAFGAQGIASVTVLDDDRAVVSLLAAGSTDPDVVEMRLNVPASLTAAVSRLDRPSPLFEPSAGLEVIDVADISGAVVVAVDPKNAATGMQVGDVIVGANGQGITNASAFEALLSGRAAGQTLAVEMKDAGGTSKHADVAVFLTPTAMSLFDPSVLANRALLELRARLAVVTDPLEASVIHLNIGIALARTNRWTAAREELQLVQLPDGPGIGDGAVHYLLGIVADRLGDRPGAEAELGKASKSPGLLGEDGLPVSDLANAMLAELKTRPQ